MVIVESGEIGFPFVFTEIMAALAFLKGCHQCCRIKLIDKISNKRLKIKSKKWEDDWIWEKQKMKGQS